MVNEIELAIADYCKSKLDLTEANLSAEYYYQSLPLCVIDAIFSIGVRYSSTENTVKRFCDYYGLKPYSQNRPQISEQLPISEFIKLHGGYSFEEMANKIYQNKQRTSTRNGILKAEAAFRFAKVLSGYEVNYYQDIDKVLGNRDFEAKVAEIPGQSSGISTRYFYMLAGSDDYIKPDRMIARFIWSAIQQSLTVEESHDAIVGAYRILAKEYPHLTPRALDHRIWLYQREEPNPYLAKD